MPASKQITADVAVTYPNARGDGWAVLELTNEQARWIRKALAFSLDYNHSTDSVEIRDNPKAYAE